MFKFTKILFFDLTLLCFVGIFIGLFHAYDFIIATILFVGSVVAIIKKLKQKDAQKWVYIAGIFLTVIVGMLAERWGVKNNYWKYHELGGGRVFPYWLPFAWGFAFMYLYRLERKIITSQRVNSLKRKLLIIFLISAFFPVLGEVIAIHLNVWSYNLPMQVLGVPLFAFLALPALHALISVSLVFICLRFNIQDPVFSIGKENRGFKLEVMKWRPTSPDGIKVPK